MADGEREPCPYRIFEDMGGGFLLGASVGVTKGVRVWVSAR